MKFDISICKNCYWLNGVWCEAEYHKRADKVYDNCYKHIERHVGQMSIDDILRGDENEQRHYQ